MVIHQVICNKCGVDIPESVGGDYNASFGYGSEHDGETWQFELCEDCLLELISTFKHIPKGFKNNPYMSLNEEQSQRAFEGWKVTGDFDELGVLEYDELIGMAGYICKEAINETILKHHPKRSILE